MLVRVEEVANIGSPIFSASDRNFVGNTKTPIKKQV